MMKYWKDFKSNFRSNPLSTTFSYEDAPKPGSVQKSDAIYFISNREVYRYNTIERKMDKNFPVKVAGFFGGCKRRRKVNKD